MISHYCIIRDYQIISDGKVIFRGSPSINDFLNETYSELQFDYPKFYKMDNLSRLGIIACELLLKKRKLTSEYPAEKISVVLSNSNSSLDTDLRFADSAKSVASPSLFVYTLPNVVIGEICIRHKFKGENAFFVTEKFDAYLLSDYTRDVLDSGAEACIAGWINVMGEQHDVFLYLLDKNNPEGISLSAESLNQLYTSALWTS